MIIYQPYTYFIRWSKHDRQYYGVRYTEQLYTRSPEDDLWVEYFSSSPEVEEFREKHGEPDIIQIRRKFDDHEKALLWEHKVLKKMNVVNDDRWLNKSYGIGRAHDRAGKTYEQIYGNEDAKKLKQKLSEATSGEKNGMYGKTHSPETIEIIREARARQKIVHSEKTKRKMSEARKGWISPYKGMSYEDLHGDEKAEILKSQKRGENNPSFKGYIITPWGTFPTLKEAVQTCSVRIDPGTLRYWCKNNQRIVKKNAISQSNYLTIDMIGKTFKELGFDFMPKF